MNKDGLKVEENVTISQINENTKPRIKVLQLEDNLQQQLSTEEEQHLDLIGESKVSSFFDHYAIKQFYLLIITH
jgi:hypothetical protein